MSSTKTLTLAEPIQGIGGAMISEIKFREPRYEDVLDIGEPETLIGLGEGKAFFQEDAKALRAYIERLSDLDVNFLPRLGLKDTLAAKHIIKFFFREALTLTPSEEAPGTRSPEPSSAVADNQFQPSAF